MDSPVRHRKLNCILEPIVSRRVRKIDVMSKSTCEVFAQYFSLFSEIEDFYSASIANCVFNSFLSYTAIMLNIVTIHAIRKTSSLPKTLKTLLVSLAGSDVGVGLLGQPFYISSESVFIEIPIVSVSRCNQNLRGFENSIL